MQAGSPAWRLCPQGHNLRRKQRSPSSAGATVTAAGREPLASRFATRSLVVLFAINILNFYDRQVLASLTEPVRNEFHLSDAQVGGFATAFTLVYALIGVPLGRLADRSDRKKLLASGLSVWGALTASTAFASSYGFLLF